MNEKKELETLNFVENKTKEELSFILNIIYNSPKGIHLLYIEELRITIIVLTEFKKESLEEFIFDKEEKQFLFKFKSNEENFFRIRQVQDKEYLFFSNSKDLMFVDTIELSNIDLNKEELSFNVFKNKRKSFNIIF